MVIKELKHEGHEGNEGGLSDDYVDLPSILARDGQKEITTLRESLTFVSFVFKNSSVKNGRTLNLKINQQKE